MAHVGKTKGQGWHFARARPSGWVQLPMHMGLVLGGYDTTTCVCACVCRVLLMKYHARTKLVQGNHFLFASFAFFFVPPPTLSFPTPGKTVPHHPLGDGHQVTVPHPPLGNRSTTVHAHL